MRKTREVKYKEVIRELCGEELQLRNLSKDIQMQSLLNTKRLNPIFRQPIKSLILKMAKEKAAEWVQGKQLESKLLQVKVKR